MASGDTVHSDLLADRPMILAPMAGFSDSPYRRITRRFGSRLSFTELISADGIVRQNQKTLDMLRFTAEERPIIVQLFGSDPNILGQAAGIVADYGFDGIDLNMGCSVRKVAGKGAGAGLLKEPQRAADIVVSMKEVSGLPVSAKIRLGWNQNTLNYLTVVEHLEKAGVRWVSVHGRTAAQGYGGYSDWNAIAEIKRHAHVPVLGNGDIKTAELARQRMRTSGVDGVLIGRAAIGNPLIFSGESADDGDSSGENGSLLESGDPDAPRNELWIARLKEMVLEHLDLMLSYYDQEHGLTLFRKHVVGYVRGLPGAASLRNRLVTCEDPHKFRRIVESL